MTGSRPNQAESIKPRVKMKALQDSRSCRSPGQVVDHIGQQGIFGGSLNVPHALAADSKGNIYVGENFDGRRFQRFVYKGMGVPTGKTLPPPKP
jgi:hypothetical protein